MNKEKKPRTCKTCGNEFLPTTGGQRYCSPDCLKKGSKRLEIHKCFVCGRDFEVQYNSTAQRCPDCRSKKNVSVIDTGVRATRKCTFTPNVDNTPDGPKLRDMWLPPIPEEAPRKPVKARIRCDVRKLPRSPYPPTEKPAGLFDEEPEPVRRVHNYEMKREGFRYTPELDRKIKEMYFSGFSFQEIGDELGKSAAAVMYHARMLFGGVLPARKKVKHEEDEAVNA